MRSESTVSLPGRSMPGVDTETTGDFWRVVQVTRPVSHHDQPHERCCGNCRFGHLVAYKLDLLCFHGDHILVLGKSEYPVTSEFVQMDGEEVGMLDGDEYSKVWAGRITDSDDVCDEWKAEIQ